MFLNSGSAHGGMAESQSEMMPWNKKLKKHEEFAVCTYLDRLDKIGLHDRLFMTANYTNAVLHRAHVGEGPPPQVDEHCAFWNDTPSILCTNNQSKRSAEGKYKTPIPFPGGFMSSR